MKHLERLPLDEGEMLQLSLLGTPPLGDAAVPDDHLLAILVETRVQMEGQVPWCGHVHRDPKKQQSPPVLFKRN